MGRSYLRAILIVLPLIFIFSFVLIGVVSLLEDNIFEAGSALLGQPLAPQAEPTPVARPAPLALVSLQDGPTGLLPYRSVALGFAVDYPTGWRKKENTLEVIFSPSTTGLDMKHVQDGAVWIGIPAEDVTEARDVLEAVAAGFPVKTGQLNPETVRFAGQEWLSVQLRFGEKESGQQVIATIAATRKNGVGYFVVATAPAERWTVFEPFFDKMMATFNFIVEAEIPPTPTGPPPPTPTATPTPVIYIVQPGDTLSGISARYGVDMEALATRNSIERPELLRSGEKLIIPLKRR